MTVRQLTQRQVVELWGFIETVLRAAFPEANHIDIRNLLHRVSTGSMQFWVMSDDGETRKARAICMSEITPQLGGHKCLFLRALYSPDNLSMDEWSVGFEAIAKFAKENGCSTIEAETGDPRVLGIADTVGFKKIMTRVAKEV